MQARLHRCSWRLSVDGLTLAPAMSDVDGLKALNDDLSYEAGDALLRAKVGALSRAGLEAYHDKGDEFLYRAESAEDLQAKLGKASAILRDMPIEVKTTDGKTLTFKETDQLWQRKGPHRSQGRTQPAQDRARRCRTSNARCPSTNC